jgi:hypothetical protein
MEQLVDRIVDAGHAAPIPHVAADETPFGQLAGLWSRIAAGENPRAHV